MSYMYNKHDSNNFLIDDATKEDDFLIPPLYYYGKWPSVFGITKANPPDNALAYYKSLPDKDKPTYVVFWKEEKIQQRVDSLKKRFPQLIYEATIEPSLIDKTLHWLNPKGNDNETAFIYRLPK